MDMYSSYPTGRKEDQIPVYGGPSQDAPTPSASELFANPDIEEKLYEVKNNRPVERSTGLQPKPAYASDGTQQQQPYQLPYQQPYQQPQQQQPYQSRPSYPIDPDRDLRILAQRQVEELEAELAEKERLLREMNEKLVAAERRYDEQAAINGMLSAKNDELFAKSERLNAQNDELAAANDALFTEREELSAKNEELAAANEELATAKEELVAAAEEQAAQIEKLEEDNETLSKREEILKSDWNNYRKRVEDNREKDKALACEGIVKSLLAAIDDLERSIDYAGQYETDVDGLIEGNKAILRRVLTILSDYDVEIIDASGDFDANIHCAIGREKADDVEPGSIVQVVQTGYMLKDKVLRPASVIVSY